MPVRERSPSNRASLGVFLVLFASTVVLSGQMIAPYIITVITGGILAVLVAPLQAWLQRRFGDRKQLVALLITVGMVLLVVTPMLLLSTLAVRQATELGQYLSSSEELSFEGIVEKLRSFGPLDDLLGSQEELQSHLREWGTTAGGKVTALILGFAKALPDVILQLFIACLACYFFLLDGARFVVWLAEKLMVEADLRRKLGDTFKDTAVAVIWASTAAALSQAALMLVAFLALGVPAAALAAGATFLFAWIPILGSTPVWIAGAAFLYLKGSFLKLGLMVVAGVITGVIDNFVRPLVLKGRGEMHPLVSLVAIFGGIQMFGIVGVFFGPIVAAMLITLLRIWPTVAQRSGLAGEQP